MSERPMVLAGQLTLPEEMAWFNNLDPEQRNEFLLGLLRLVAMDDGRREKVLNEYLQSWQTRDTRATGPLEPLSRAFLDKVEQTLDTLLMQKEPAKDVVESVRKVRTQTAEIWSDSVNQAFFDRFAGQGE